MSFEFLQKLPTPAEIRAQYPVPKELALLKEKRDAQIKDVITGKSDKFLVIIGPCSADNEDSVCDYVNRLAAINIPKTGDTSTICFPMLQSGHGVWRTSSTVLR